MCVSGCRKIYKDYLVIKENLLTWEVHFTNELFALFLYIEVKAWKSLWSSRGSGVFKNACLFINQVVNAFPL